MPIAMAIGVAMLPGTAAAQATTGNGGLELCPGGVGGIGSSWGPLSSAVGLMNCSSTGEDSDGMSFSLNNSAADNGAWGFNSNNITARVTGYDDGRLELKGMGGINMLNTVSMTDHKITDLAAGDVSSASSDAVNGQQLYQYTRYFNANSSSTDASTDAQATGANSIASGPSARALQSNSSAYGASAIALAPNSVALGAGSQATRADTVSVGYLSADGTTSYTRQITNVTAGSAGTDAVNVNQLNAAIASVDGGGSGVVADNPVTYDTSASKLITLKGANGTKITNLTAGDISSALSMDAVNGSQLYQTNQNVANVANNVAGVSGNLANVTNVVNNIVSNGLAGSPLVVTYDSSAQDQLTLGGVGRTTTVKLTNVAPGDISSTSTDAVNGGQLYETNQNLIGLAANVGNLAESIYSRGVMYFHAKSSLADSSADGSESVAIGGAAVASADNSIALGSNSVADRVNAVSVGAAGAERQIINVAQGTTDTDAVNVKQMNTAIANASIGSGPGVADAVVYDSSVHDKLTLGGATAAAPQVLVTNLAAGQVAAGSSDAVNGDQLYKSASGLASALGAGASVNPDGTITAPGYLISGTTYNNIGSALSALNSAAGDLVNASKYVKVVSNGAAALVGGSDAVAIGGTAYATGTGALAIGSGSSAAFDNSTAVGANAVTDAEYTVSVGNRTQQSRITNVANGINPTDAATMAQLNALQTQLTSSSTSGVKSMMQSPATVLSYIAVSSNTVQGTATSATDDMNTMAIGPAAGAAGSNALAVGARSGASGDFTTAVGSGAGALSMNSTAIGASAIVGALSDASVSIGYNTRVNSNNALALGAYAFTSGSGSVALGYNSLVNNDGTYGMALGPNSTVSAANGVAIGYGAIADRANTVSVGNATTRSQIINVAAGTQSTDAVNVGQLSGVAAAIGGGATVNPDGTIKTPSFAIGGQTYSDVGSALVGSAANSVQYDTSDHTRLTLGGTDASAPVTLSNVASGVADDDAVNMGQLKQLGMTVDSNGNVTNSFVAYDDTALGTITLKGTNGTTITNVKAGALTANSLDAVNGSQLYQTNADVANVAGNVTNVAGNVANVTNIVNNIVVDGGGIKYFHTNSTLADSSASGPDAVAIGGAASATAANSVALGTNSVAGRANTVSVGAAGAERQIVNVANATNSTDAVNLSQLQAMGANVDSNGAVTNTFVAYDDGTKNKITFGGVGSSMPVLLTNLAPGQLAASSSDATTGAQLYNIAQSTANALGGGASILANGTLSAPSYVITGQTYADVGSALSAVDGEMGQMNSTFASGLKYVKAVSTEPEAVAGGTNSIAIGGSAYATGNKTLAIGTGSNATFDNSTAIGVNAATDAEYTVSVGNRTQQMRITNVANGINPTDAATMAQLNALQTQLASSSTSGTKSMMQSSAAVLSYIAVSSNTVQGTVTSASDDMNAMAIGPAAMAVASNALAVGARAGVSSPFGTAVGSGAGALSANSTAIGASAIVGALSDGSVSIGYNTRVNSTNALALGAYAFTSGSGSVALGYNALVTDNGTYGLALGPNSTVSAANGVAIGYSAIADRANAVSVGNATTQSQIINVAAGTQNTDAVNLGQMKAAITAAASGGSTDAVIYDTSAHDVLTLGGASTAPAVKLTNVAAGALTSSSKDAINGSQLYNTANSVAEALGSTVTVGADGKVSKPTYALNGQTYTDVGAALAALASGGGGASADSVVYDTTSHDKLTLNKGGSAVTVSNVANGVADSDAVNVSQLKTMGMTLDANGNVANAFVAYDDTSKTRVTFGGIGSSTPVVLANVGAGQVTASSKEAINGSQLYSAMNSTAAALGGGATVGSDGQVSKPVYTVGGNSYSGVGSAIGALNAAIVGDGNPDSVIYDTSAHDKLTLGGADGSASPVTIANVAAATADDQAVNLKQLKDAGLNVDSSGNVTNSFASYDDASKETLTFNPNGNATRLKNVADGVDSTDAVNVGQMQTYVANYVSTNPGSGGTANAVAYDDSTKSTVTLGGTDAAAPVKLTNVAAGTSATDAVNYGQFSSLQSTVNNILDGTGGSTYFNVGTPADGTAGTAAVASGSDAVAIGNGAAATGNAAIAIGKGAVTAGDNSVAMGAGASAPNANAVALGANSTTDRDNSVSVGSVGTERQITNVAAGTQGTDAVNMNQLNSAMGNMSNTINNVDRNAAKGIASASALNIVTPYLPGRTTLNAGIANYRGYQAVGLGVSRWNEKGTINYNLGVSTSGGNSTIVRAGIGIVLGN